MGEQMNGHSVAQPNAVQQAGAGALDRVRAAIDTQARAAVGVTVRGLLVSAPGIPPIEIMNAVARVTGALLAEAIVADLGTSLRLRTAFKEAFADGIAKTPPKQPPLDDKASLLRRS